MQKTQIWFRVQVLRWKWVKKEKEGAKKEARWVNCFSFLSQVRIGDIVLRLVR